MKALCWYGKRDVRIEEVAEPTIINPRDAIVAVSSAGICGSDLQIWNGRTPSMRAGDILGHEFMGEVVEIGPEVHKVQRGDRVVVPYPISCGGCWHCKREEWSLCDNTNPNAWMAEKLFGYSPAAIYGSSHVLGGYAGGQAQYVRVPFADVGCLKIERDLDDEQVLLLADTLPTAYMAVEQAGIQPDDSVLVWGAGPIGQLAVSCARLFEPRVLIAIDTVPLRLQMARDYGGAQVIDESLGRKAVREVIEELTGGRGPSVVIAAASIESNGHGVGPRLEEHENGFETGLPSTLWDAIRACQKGGRVSIPGSYVSSVEKIPLGAAASKSLSFKMGHAHVHRYMRPLLERIEKGELDSSFVVTHKMVLSDAPVAYELFRQVDGCVKVLLEP